MSDRSAGAQSAPGAAASPAGRRGGPRGSAAPAAVGLPGGAGGPGGGWLEGFADSAERLVACVASPGPLAGVGVEALRGHLGLIGRVRGSLAALEASVVGEVARREGQAAAAEALRRTQKRSRSAARKTVEAAGDLEWTPRVAERLATGEITPEAAGQIARAATETQVDQDFLLHAAGAESQDRFRRTLKDHVTERTSRDALEARRRRQRKARRASISEQPDGMWHLFAALDPLAGARMRAALLAKTDALFRAENPTARATAQQRLADALEQLACDPHHPATGQIGNPARADGTGGAANSGRGDGTSRNGSAGESPGAGRAANSGRAGGSGRPVGVELIVLADFDAISERITAMRLVDGTPLTADEALALSCDAGILPGVKNKDTGDIAVGRTTRKVSPRLRKRLVARDQGCIGCGAAEQICEVHHIDHWAHGGQTTYDNTCLMCRHCHHTRCHLHGEQVTRDATGKLQLGPPQPPDEPPRRQPDLWAACTTGAWASTAPAYRAAARRRATDKPEPQPPGPPDEPPTREPELTRAACTTGARTTTRPARRGAARRRATNEPEPQPPGPPDEPPTREPELTRAACTTGARTTTRPARRAAGPRTNPNPNHPTNHRPANPPGGSAAPPAHGQPPDPPAPPRANASANTATPDPAPTHRQHTRPDTLAGLTVRREPNRRSPLLHNHHRVHSAVDRNTPAATPKDNLPGIHA